MKFTITLGKVRTRIGEVMIPFWFTGDGSIHLNSQTSPELVLDTDELSLQQLKQLHASILQKELTTDNIECIEKAIDVLDIKTKKEDKPQTATKTKTPATLEEVAELKERQLKSEAEKIASLSISKIADTIGEDTITDGHVLASGVNDIDLLNLIHEIESKNTKPRKKVLNIIKKRIQAIETVSTVISSDESSNIEELVEDVAETTEEMQINDELVASHATTTVE